MIALLREHWPSRFCKGRVCHVALNGLELPDGSKINLRLLLQTTVEQPHTEDVIEV